MRETKPPKKPRANNWTNDPANVNNKSAIVAVPSTPDWALDKVKKPKGDLF